MPRPTVETEIGGHRFRLTYMTPADAIPLMGRLTALLGPAIGGTIGQIAAGFLERGPDAAVTWAALRESAGASLPTALREAFTAKFGDPAFMPVLTDIAATVTVLGKTTGAPLGTLADLVRQDEMAGPAGIQTALHAIGWATWKQFGLPFFSSALASGPPPDESAEPSASEPASAPVALPSRPISRRSAGAR